MAARRILHVFSTFAVGGPQRRFADLVGRIDGLHHRVVAMDGCHDAVSILPDGANVELIPFAARKTSTISPRNLTSLREVIRTHRPDVVCTYNWGAMEAVLAWRMMGRGKPKLVHCEDGFGPDESLDCQNPKRVMMRRLALRGVPVVVPSRGLERLATGRWGLPATQLHYIPNGVDTDRFCPGPAPDRLRIGWVGAVRREKNLHRLLNIVAARQGPAADVIIAGAGPQLAEIQAAAEGCPFPTMFPGYLNDTADIYRDFSVLAMSSDTEQMPLSVLEAMASGLPVVSTDVGDIRQMVSDENRAFIVPLGNDAALTRALDNLLADQSRRAEIGAANRQRAEAVYSMNAMVARWAAVWGMPAFAQPSEALSNLPQEGVKHQDGP